MFQKTRHSELNNKNSLSKVFVQVLFLSPSQNFRVLFFNPLARGRRLGSREEAYGLRLRMERCRGGGRMRQAAGGTRFGGPRKLEARGGGHAVGHVAQSGESVTIRR